MYRRTIDTTLPAIDNIRFRKKKFNSCKMTITDQIKVLKGKFMQNEAQYDLDRKAAKISEYLTGEDLGLKPSTVE